MIRTGAVALALATLVACSGAPRPAAPPAPPAPTDEVPPDDQTGLEADPAGRDEAPLDERIAAIELGMNQLAPVANQCWAAAAADDFHLAGEVRLQVAIAAATGKATAAVTADTTGDDVLTRCLTTVAAAFGWGPPLRGQVIELPFRFAAPAMQNVVDRRFVPRKTQAGVEVGVLIDEVNSGNPAASVIEVGLAARARKGPRDVERTEVWYFLAPATVEAVGGAARAVGAGDVVVAPAGTRLTVAAGDAPAAAVVAIVPGGREGVARGGALPGAAASSAVRARPVQPTVIAAAAARRFPRTGGATTVLVEPPLVKGAVSASWFEADAGVAVPPHVHPKETELLYVLGGGGTMIVAGTEVPVTEHSVVQIPAGVEHAFVATGATTALQLYVPAGPEQRFKTMK
ncbi:MAG TPA: cupin domain-containing protein [Kofleriaceae bacterium]|nr:cupin domain-containing protein [Kofleriaceae bacterium]